MKAALHISSFSFGEDKDLSINLKAIAKTAEDVGFSTITVMDHYFQIEHNGSYKQPMMEAYTTLGFIAACTKKVTLGTLVTGVTYREPAFLVKQITALDVLSQGRAFMGIGAAWNEQECIALGFPFPPLKERFERLEETIQIAKQMWSDNNSSYKGKYYTLEETLNMPQVLTKPHPRILIGGGGEKKTLKFVAMYADACNLFSMLGTETIKHKLDILKEHCKDVGRDYSEIEKTALIRINPQEGFRNSIEECIELSKLGIDKVFFTVPKVENISNLEDIGKNFIPQIEKL